MTISYPLGTRLVDHAEWKVADNIKRATFGQPIRASWTSRFAQLKALLSGGVSRGWGQIPLTALVLMSVAIGLQPALPEDEAVMSATEAAIGYGILGFVLLSYIGGALMTARGSRAGLTLSLPATLLMLFLIVSCPVSGHHGWGSWVVGSFGAAFVATGLHAASVYATRRPSP
jgi:hypothetical protein